MAGLRGCAGAAALGNRIYVCDGGVADNYYETVEILNPEMGAFMTGQHTNLRCVVLLARTLHHTQASIIRRCRSRCSPGVLTS